MPRAWFALRLCPEPSTRFADHVDARRRVPSGEHVSINFLGTPLALFDDIRKSAIRPQHAWRILSLAECLTAPQHQEGHLTLHLVCLDHRSHDPGDHTSRQNSSRPHDWPQLLLEAESSQVVNDIRLTTSLGDTALAYILRLWVIFTARSPAERATAPWGLTTSCYLAPCRCRRCNAASP